MNRMNFYKASNNITPASDVRTSNQLRLKIKFIPCEQ